MPKKKTDEEPKPKQLTLHTCPLTLPQAQKLRALLTERGWKFEARQYMLYFAQGDKITVAVYEKGPKCVIQGKGTEEFVRFTLEPEILGEARLGYEELHNPRMFEPHFGIDESGKGDFFGPLVIAGAYTDRDSTYALMEAGVMDSKRITSDARIRELAGAIRDTEGVFTVVEVLQPSRYNQLYDDFGNLNKLLARGHAVIIEALAKKVPTCPRALSDQFAAPILIKRAMGEAAKHVELESRTKAESDVAVAAASILAREAFVNWLRDMGRELGMELPKGISPQVKEAAGKYVDAHGPQALRRVAKVHFRTAAEVAPGFYTAKPKMPWMGGSRRSAAEPSE
jgi:ribonuclease HIII